MHKEFFRWFDGELLSGKYYKLFVDFLNYYADKTYRPSIEYNSNVVFKIEGEGSIDTSKEVYLTESDLESFGEFIGYLRKKVLSLTTLGSVYFTKGNALLERGLFEIALERFTFFENLTEPIFNKVTSSLRGTLVPASEAPYGYIKYIESPPEGHEVFLSDGSYNPLRVLTDEPTDGSLYYPIYAEEVNGSIKGRYLCLEREYESDVFIDITTYKKMLDVLQLIRYNGSSYEYLLTAVNLLLEDYMYDISFEQDTSVNKKVMHYKLNQNRDLPNKTNRMSAFNEVVNLKYKNLVLEEEQ